jgi:hypothetical protein
MLHRAAEVQRKLGSCVGVDFAGRCWRWRIAGGTLTINHSKRNDAL